MEKNKHKHIKENIKIGKWVSSDLIFSLLKSNQLRLDYNDGYKTKIPNIVLESAFILNCLPKNMHNEKNHEIIFTKDKLKKILKRFLPINSKVSLDNEKKEAFDIIFNLFQKSIDENIQPLITKEKNYYRLGDVNDYFKLNNPEHSKLFKIHMNDRILKNYPKKMNLLEELSFLSLLYLIIICPDIIFTHNQIHEILHLTKYKLNKFIKKYKLKSQIIYRTFTEHERMVLNGYELQDTIRKENTSINLYERNNYKEHQSLYKGLNYNIDDNIYRMPIGFRIENNKKTIKETINKILNQLDNNFQIDLDVLTTIKYRIENESRYSKIGFKKTLRRIRSSKNSKCSKKNLERYRIDFNRMNIFLHSELNRDYIEKIGKYIFNNSTGFMIKSRNNKKKIDVNCEEIPTNLRKKLFKQFFKANLPEFYDQLQTRQINKLIKNSTYKTNYKIFQDLYTMMGCNLNSSEGADRLNILNEFRQKLYKLNKDSKQIVKKTSKIFFEYCLNIVPLISKNYYFSY